MLHKPFFFTLLLSFIVNFSLAQEINLLFVGDIMGHKPQIKSAEITKNKKYNYDPVFKYVKPIIEKADLAIANLEVTLPGKPPYQGYPRFRSPDEIATSLRTAGFDILTTSNNHSNDAGKDGVIQTIKTVKENDFYQTGTFNNQAERDLLYPLVVYKKGFKLVFLNYTYDTNGIPTREPTVVLEIDEKMIKKDIEEAKKFNADAIIVLMHWGKEYVLEGTKKQQKLADKMLAWGADHIIGGHPHVVEPIVEKTIQVDSTTSRKAVVVYSLGNFISNQTKPNTDGGIMFEMTLQKKNGVTSLKKYNYIPVWRYIHKDTDNDKKRTYHALPIAAFENGNESKLKMNEKAIAAMKKYGKHVRDHLNNSDAKERKVTLGDLKIKKQKTVN